MVGLEQEVVKFTGDGWLIMTDKIELVSSLCCLALVMAHRFQSEMSDATGIDVDSIPPLRLAISFGKDYSVKTPGGNRDWVGDSARRAVNSGYCEPNAIVIDETVRGTVHRDFVTETFDRLTATTKPKREEEELTLYLIKGIKDLAVDGTDVPEHYINTLTLIGEKLRARRYAYAFADYFVERARSKDVSADLLLLKWNRLLASNITYETASEVFNQLLNSRVRPDVFSYTILMRKAPNIEVANRLMTQMKKSGIGPDVVTYNTLINLAPDYATAVELQDEMKKERNRPRRRHVQYSHHPRA
ncbi:MAG: hypothetical protein IPJ30_13065 [Acidobacteria bacterium]|nr:hypothetical protein [Acidobacteriota bacterium]